jgi:uncharacterized protein (DUF4213/DUF364 family)
VKDTGALQEKSALELAGLAHSERLLEAAIGLATINSLLEVDENRCCEMNAGNLVAEKGAGKRVAIVGHFPFVTALRDTVKELWVIENNPKPGDLPAERAADLIPRADVVGITGTAVTNHTLESLLALCKPNSYVVILGDSAPLSELFFECGVDAVAGTRVFDPDLALKCVSQGANYRQIKGIKKLIMFKDTRQY